MANFLLIEKLKISALEVVLTTLIIAVADTHFERVADENIRVGAQRL